MLKFRIVFGNVLLGKVELTTLRMVKTVLKITTVGGRQSNFNKNAQIIHPTSDAFFS